MNPLKQKGFWLSLGGIVFVDQLSKLLAGFGWFGQNLITNPGFSFGWRFGSTQILTVVLSLVWLIMGWILLTHYRDKYVYIGIFLGGSLSNLLDRIIWGGVRDWISWPIFQVWNNLADWAIALAIGGMILEYWYRKWQTRQKWS